MYSDPGNQGQSVEKNPGWFNIEVKVALKEKQDAFKILNQNNTEGNLNIYIEIGMIN